MIKEMIYSEAPTDVSPRTAYEILARGFYKGYEWACVSYYRHPCAYIALFEGQPYFNSASEDYENIDIDCHGGCTYVEKGLRDIFDKSRTVIGWDYAHCGDFTWSTLPPLGFDSKKWTTQEMITECKDVIEQLYFLEHPELKYS